jgi:alpha-tubulin suppressor-like RCC1 family protein
VILASVFYFQSTLASNISINSGTAIEFGQAVKVTTTCSGASSLTVIPKSSFVNVSNGKGAHYISSVSVSGIPSSCEGKDFSLSFYDSATGSSALPIFSFFGDNKRAATVFNSAGYFQQGFQSSGTDVSSASGAFTVTFKTPIALSTDSMKITLQSTEHKDWAEASIVSLAAYTCTVLNSSGVKCWGNNDQGQLGDGTTTDSSNPISPSGLNSNVIEIATGNNHTCALLNTGFMKCWGLNGSGRLGDGTITTRTTPVDVQGLSGVSAISTGGTHTCALLRTGALKCWGTNVKGQVGNGTDNQQLTPTDVTGLSSGVIAITAGQFFTCALLNTGAVNCWGDNASGQLGNGTTTTSFTPVNVSGLSAGVIAIAAGYDHTCALLNTGGVQCWGSNTYGALGNGGTGDQSTPQTVSNISNAVAISGGQGHSCALLSTGAVQCWGYNLNGQLGNGGTTNSSIPVSVSNLSSGVIAIGTGYSHSCAVLSTGAAKCWGLNAQGQLGDGTLTRRTAPVSVTGIP